jgi:alpha-beta hydrolase superfamily lysophospholipase
MHLISLVQRHTLRPVLAALLAVPACGPLLHAADDPVTSLPLAELNRLFDAKDWAGIESLCLKLRADHPTNPEVDYELACAQNRLQRPDDAMTNLALCVKHGFTDANRAATDDDLATLRDRDDFKALIASIKAIPIGANEPHEPGADIDGVKTIEAQPVGGLSYRLRLGATATPAKPHRLVLWLHPSGGSGDSLVEPLAPELAKHGFALAVFPQKQYAGWTDQERTALAPTIADLAKVPGLNATKPVLMGFSAGGQAALMMWELKPAAYGGLLLNSAYPVDVNMATRQAALITLTKDEIDAKVPVLAIIGGDDPSIQTWMAEGPVWAKAGIPVSMSMVKGKKHEFLYSGDAWKAVLKFLDALPATAAKAAEGDHPFVP